MLNNGGWGPGEWEMVNEADWLLLPQLVTMGRRPARCYRYCKNKP